MNIILLSGGSGKRLWPISNDVRSKQFLKLFLNESNQHESLAQRICRQIRAVAPSSNIVIATTSSQASILEAQTQGTDICIEPERKDTFPAIALASLFLIDKKNSDVSEPIVVCPADMYVENDFFESLLELSKQAKADPERLFLMGIKPNCPSEKFGYILPESQGKLAEVSAFYEKPTEKKAVEYIGQGALWNCGVFSFSSHYIKKQVKALTGYDQYIDLYNNYDKLEKISFDYAVAETEKNISVLNYEGEWNDLGTWDSLITKADYSSRGDVIVGNCVNTHVINELETPVITLGLKDTLIATSPDGILVTSLSEASSLKDYTSKVDIRPMQEERKWGTYKVLQNDREHESLTKELVINAGQNISYQLHNHRDEIWTIISGEGIFVLDGKERKVVRGDTVCIRRGEKHAIKALKELHIIEVQIGDTLVEEDIERLDYHW